MTFTMAIDLGAVNSKPQAFALNVVPTGYSKSMVTLRPGTEPSVVSHVTRFGAANAGSATSNTVRIVFTSGTLARMRRLSPMIVTRTRIVLIQHVLELTERSNTGRHAAAALSNIDVRVFGQKDVPLKADDLEGAWLLWPGEPELPESIARPSTIVVLDGSWSQSRKMMQRVPEFRALRRWSLPAPAGRRSLRAAPAGGMSSLEAIAEAITQLEGEQLGARVRAVHEALVQRQLEDRGYAGSES